MESILSESDVEQKFILPLLTKKYPEGLNYSSSDFQTKANIRKFEIDKGNSKKIYFPDYIIVSNGYPIMIIEAKSPDEDVIEGFREARLYAHELNAMYATNTNPCMLIIATNYLKTIFGFWDQEIPEIEFSNAEIVLSQKNYYEFISKAQKSSIEDLAHKLLKKERGNTQYKKPVFLLGGIVSPSEMIGDNSFGSNISIDYKGIYNPTTEEERKNIVLNAYVNSRKRDSHVDPISKVIKRSGIIETEEMLTIQDTSNPKEIVDTLRDHDRYKKAVFILVGTVGSGKSTFVDYLRYCALSDDIKKSTFWINLNMNNAPESSELIYKWVINQSIDQIRRIVEDDLDSLDTLNKVFHNEIDKFNKGPIKLFDKESDQYKQELFNIINQLKNDEFSYFNSLLKYYFAERKILPIIILDNADKRSRDLQLLMFDVANWLKTTYTCLVFLPLRDTTFDQYKRTPPLDTAIKDLMFRIDPPLLDKVLQARFEYVLRELKIENKDFHYTLRNGIRVECKREEIGFYLKSILRSIFENDLVKRMFLGIAGRDIRKGIEFFLDFCKSGYILEDTILKIKNSNGEYNISTVVAMQIIIKGSRRFYYDEDSRVKNIYKMYREDSYPNPFIRCAILKWLQKNTKNMIEQNHGYYDLLTIKTDLLALGMSEDRIEKEVYSLMLADCIINESQKLEYPKEEDRFSITSCGLIHLELLRNIYYLSFISEDNLFYDENKAQKIAQNLLSVENFPFISYQSVLENARILIYYLKEYYNRSNYQFQNFLEKDRIEDYTGLEELREWIDKRIAEDEHFVDYDQLELQYPKGNIYEGQIVYITRSGYIVEFGLNGKGFLESKYKRDDFEIGTIVSIEVEKFNRTYKRFQIKIA